MSEEVAAVVAPVVAEQPVTPAAPNEHPSHFERVLRSRITRMYARTRDRETRKGVAVLKAAAKRHRKAARRLATQ